MARRRRRRGFEPTGTCAPEQLGLPTKRSKELKLAVAWREVAGDVLAGRAEVVRVTRGTLEVQVDERRWEVTTRALLPRLAARLSRGYPALGVRRCRLLVVDGESVRRGEAVDLDQAELRAEGAPRARRRGSRGESKRKEPPAGEDIAGRLARVGERYLERAEQREIRKRSGRGPAGPSDPR
jgi:hypothetical protein